MANRMYGRSDDRRGRDDYRRSEDRRDDRGRDDDRREGDYREESMSQYYTEPHTIMTDKLLPTNPALSDRIGKWAWGAAIVVGAGVFLWAYNDRDVQFAIDSNRPAASSTTGSGGESAPPSPTPAPPQANPGPAPAPTPNAPQGAR
jgi:hypothetical protein